MVEISDLLHLQFEPNYKRFPGRLLICEEVEPFHEYLGRSTQTIRFNLFYGYNKKEWGEVRIDHYERDKGFGWAWFNPLRYVDERREGLGTLAHAQVLDCLRNLSGIESYRIMHYDVLDERQKMLESMGFDDFCDPKPFPFYFSKSIEYALKKGVILAD